jgi:hypothetical protein
LERVLDGLREPGRDPLPSADTEARQPEVPSSSADVLHLAQQVADLLAAAQGQAAANPVSVQDDQPARTDQPAGDGDDDTVTSPMPVILPGATTVPRPAPIEVPRGPFEAARPSPPATGGPATAEPAYAPSAPHGRPSVSSGGPSAPPGRPGAPPGRHVSVTGSVPPPPAASATVVRPPQRQMREAAEQKLDQLKDLYLTAEAIGEDALGKHFDQVSQRQEQLIRDFFRQAEPEGPAAAGP